jgi:hypothetical protein
MVSPGGNSSAMVTTLLPVAQGELAIPILSNNFVPSLSAGSSVRLRGTSAFLDPDHPTFMKAEPGRETIFDIQSARIGKHYTIEAWEAEQERGGKLFLRAVGPGDVTFAAYVPLVRDVFSFTDLPPEGTGVYHYSYLVTGWYSDPEAADPMRGVNVFIPGIWKDQEQWESQTPVERFQALLAAFRWSLSEKPTTALSTSLYQSFVSDVEWPYPVGGQATVDPNHVLVAVGNTAIDGVAALIDAYAQKEARENPNEKNAWLAAGKTLSNLMQAAQYDLLKEYGKPGGSALIEQQIHQAWYGSEAGSTLWEVVALDPNASGEQPPAPDLTPEQQQALHQQLAALNTAQDGLNQQRLQLTSLQADLYMMWWKIGRAYSSGFGKTPTTTPPWNELKLAIEEILYPELLRSTRTLYCTVAEEQSRLPDANNKVEANRWANVNWSFPKSGGGNLKLADLGLKLKAGESPRFWHPNDPVVLIAGLCRAHKHGEDGRFSDDNTLLCRLPDQTIKGVEIDGQPRITVDALRSKGVNLDPCGAFRNIPEIGTLVHEAFLADPLNAPIMTKALGGNSDAVKQGITELLQRKAGPNKWIGTSPVPFALQPWTQAWTPLFLEWSVKYFPTGVGSGPAREFSLSDWTFNGEHYTWNGTGFDDNYLLPYSGRTFLTPQAPLLFKAKIEKYLEGRSDIDTEQLKKLIATVADWDLMSQNLSGLSDRLITRFSQEAFPPPPCDDMTINCLPHEKAPSITALIGRQFTSLPVLQGSGADVNYFSPVRGGFLKFEKLQVVDEFGQTLNAARPNTPYGFQPFLGQGLSPDAPDKLPFGSVQLPPRIIQATRLNLHFNANDGSGLSTVESVNPNGICGWLLPNHLDVGIAVYDQDGILLGELLALPEPNNWRPRPGPPGPHPPPATPADIPNSTLRGVVSSIAKQNPDVFRDVLRTIDETLWMVDPLGGRKDQFLSVLIGRPLAVVEVQLSLRVDGNPATDCTWNKMVAPPYNPPRKPLHDTGVLTKVPFPVRLGSLQLRDDGLIGYYLPASGYKSLYCVHYPDKVSDEDKYLRRIVNGVPGKLVYQGDIYLKPQVDTVKVALILDPRGKVHAYTGILPVTIAALPGGLVEDFIQHLKVTFHTGPIIADSGTLRLPQPAEEQGTWLFLQRVAPPQDWEVDPIVDADDQARLPEDQLQLREGWLELSGLKEQSSKKD